MGKFTHWLFMCVSMAGIAVVAIAPVHARGPGSGRGMGSGGPTGFAGSQSTTMSSSAAGQRFSNPGFNHSGSAPSNIPNSRFDAPTDNRGITQQQINAARNYEHRLDQVQRLRAISERNGNSHLLDTASRMETRATQQYERRAERIGSLSTQQDQNPLPRIASVPPQPDVNAPTVPRQAEVPKNRRWWQWPFRR